MLTRVVDETGMTLEGSVEIGEIPQGVANTCYRVLQESVMNVVQHAQASRLGVFVSEGENGIVGRVEDDGTGFDLEDRPGSSSMHLGIASMRDRVESAGGRFQIEAHRAKGRSLSSGPSRSHVTDAPTGSTSSPLNLTAGAFRVPRLREQVRDRADDEREPVRTSRYASVASTASAAFTPARVSVAVSPASSKPRPPGVSGIMSKTAAAT